MKSKPVLEVLAVPVAEGGAMLGLAPSTARQYVRDGSWPCPAALLKIGKQTKVSLPILRRWLAGEIDGFGRPLPVLSTAAGSPALSGQPAASPTLRRREGQAPT